MEDNMREYLNKHGINDLLKSMVVDLCTHKPDQPVLFMQSFLQRYQAEEEARKKSTNSCDKPANVALASKRRGAISSEPGSTVKSFDIEIERTPKGKEANDRLENALKSNIGFAHLEESERKELFDVMTEKEFKAKTVIIQQGDPFGDEFYFVQEGDCDVFLKHDDGSVEHVQHIGPGGYFGELALIFNTPRAATVIAKTDVKLWSIHRIVYRKVLMDTTIRKRKQYESFLSKVPILAHLHSYEKLTVADALEPVTFEEGENVVEQDSTGFYWRDGVTENPLDFIMKGTAKVTKKDTEGNETDLGTLGPSDYFGEIALLTERPRAATVTAIEPLKCVRLDRDRFNRVLGPCEEILRRNMVSYKKYITNEL